MRRILQSGGHVFLLFKFAVLQPTCKRSNGFGKPRGIVEDNESFHARPCYNEVEVVCRTRRGRNVIVARDCAAEHYSCLEAQAGKHLIEDNPTDIVEKHIDAIGAKGRKLSANVLRLIINNAIKTELIPKPIAFGFTASGSDHPASLDLGDLTRNRSGRARCSRDYKCISRLDLPYVEYSEVSSRAGYSKQTEGEVGWHTCRKLAHWKKVRTIGRDVVLPAESTLNKFSRFVV